MTQGYGVRGLSLARTGIASPSYTGCRDRADDRRGARSVLDSTFAIRGPAGELARR